MTHGPPSTKIGLYTSNIFAGTCGSGYIFGIAAVGRASALPLGLGT